MGYSVELGAVPSSVSMHIDTERRDRYGPTPTTLSQYRLIELLLSSYQSKILEPKVRLQKRQG